MMGALPHVTTVGLPTRGASGNPKPHAVARTGATVYFSTWVDLPPHGATFEGVGVEPELRVDADLAAYASGDPTLERGLETLGQKVVRAASAH